MEMDFTRLRYFLAVAEELHFKRAADRLHITPPPLSKQIKLLERELGGPLFERDYHQVRLTPLGEKLVDPVRRILDQVAELKATADSITQHARPLRVGATAYAPSDFLDAFESAVAELTSVPSTFSIAGSAIEVAAELVAGHLDLGLIHLPPTDPRIDFRLIARYQSGIAVRSDDPLAANDLVRIEDLRDRHVAVDFARPNPVLLAALTRRLNEHGVTNIVHATATARGSELEMAAQIRNRHLVMMLAYAPGSLLSRMFSPPEFKLIPIDETTWEPSELAIAWSRAPVTAHPALDQVVDQLALRFDAR
jgi:DNA-binding transcriptional LysR family regulator